MSRKKRAIPAKNGLHKIEKPCSQAKAQMIVILGITLAISVFLISTIPSELSSIGPKVIKERSTSLLPEFNHLKEVFGQALQIRLTDHRFNITSKIDPDILLYGKLGKYTMQTTIVATEIYELKLVLLNISKQQDKLFDAEMAYFYYSHSVSEGNVYYVYVTLTLRDGYSRIEQRVKYTIICNELYMV